MHLTVGILPFKGTDRTDIAALERDLAMLGVRAQVLPEEDLPEEAYDRRRHQYRAEALLERAAEVGNEKRVLGVADVDLYMHDLNFVFGLAESPGHAAVISLYRLHSGADAATFRARAVKEAIHELGHTLGLPHCTNPGCVMRFSNCLADTDEKGNTFCRMCRGYLPLSAQTVDDQRA